MEQTNDFLSIQVNKGRRIIRILMTINILLIISLQIMSIVVGEFSFSSLVSALISILISAFIYGGSKVAKWIYIVFSGLSILRLFSILFEISLGVELINELTFGIWIMVLIPFLVNIVTSIILIFSESVNEFLYKQAN